MPDPEELAELRRRALDPESVDLDTSVMADAFLTLAEARGMRTRFANLGPPCHRVGPAPASTTASIAENVPNEQSDAEVIALRVARVPQLVRQVLRQRKEDGTVA